jgi:hypothetical protein
MVPEVNVSGTIQAGYTWAGTAHASASTRVGAYAYTPATVVDHLVGAAIVRFRLDRIASKEHMLIDIGNGGAGKSRLSLYCLNGSLQVNSKTNNVGFPQLTTAPVLVANTQYTAWMEWTATSVHLSLDGGASWHTGTRNDATGFPFDANMVMGGRGDFATLQNTNGVIGPVVVFDHRLSAVEYTEALSWVNTPGAPYEAMLPFATDVDWGGYVLRRVDLAAGTSEDQEVIAQRDTLTTRDRTPISGTAYEWQLTYLYRVNGLEWIESEPATDQATVILEQAVLSDMSPGGGTVPIRYWDNRRARPVRNVELVAGIESAEPVAFQGLLNYVVLDVGWEAKDDDYGTYLALDLVDAYRRFGLPELDADGNPIPKNLFYRDPRKRGHPVIVLDYDEQDPRNLKFAAGSMTIAQVSTSTKLEVG